MGIVKDFVTNETYVSTSNLDEGIKPEEFKYYCDMSIAGTYGKFCCSKTLLIAGKSL